MIRLKNHLQNLLKYAVLFVIGGTLYYCIEVAFRGWSHWTSFAMGGVALLFCGGLNETMFTFYDTMIFQCTISSMFITSMEYLVGIVFNSDYSIWDYRGLPFNVDGMVCLGASLIWAVLSIVAIIVDDFIRWKFFGEEYPRYKWF